MTGERIRNLIPFVHIAEVARSIASTSYWIRAQGPHERAGRLDWAALESDDTQLMLARASAPIERGQAALLFYLYVENLAAARDQLEVERRPGRRDARRQPPARRADGPQRPRRLVPDGGRDRVALPASRLPRVLRKRTIPVVPG
jgi:hypothetical protein